MATPAVVTERPTPKAQVKVVINVDPVAKTIKVDPDPFFVCRSKFEEVEWILKKPQGFPEVDCFTVHFVGQSPFHPEATFGHKRARSGCATVPAGPTLYKYTVTVPGIGTLDPHGGVTP